MKVVLLKGVEKLGKEGDVLEVKNGYARNYLIPQGIALKAIDENFKKLEELKKRKTKLIEERNKKIFALKEKIEGISVTITVEVKDDEEIYGSISEVQIFKFLKEEGIELEKGSLLLEEPIRKLGVYNLKVRLSPEVEANIRVWVVKK